MQETVPGQLEQKLFREADWGARSPLLKRKQHEQEVKVTIVREENGQRCSYNSAVIECLTEAIQGRKYSFGAGSQRHHGSANMWQRLLVS